MNKKIIGVTVGTPISPEKIAEKVPIPTKVSELDNDKGYLTEHQSLEGYAKTTDIPSLEGYAKTSDIPSLEGYAKTTDIPTVPTKVSDLDNDSGFLTEDDVVEMLPENAVEEVYIGDNPPDTAKVWINPEEEPTEFPSMKDVEDAIAEAISELTDGEAVAY